MNSKHNISAAFKALIEMPKCVSVDISYRIDINPWVQKDDSSCYTMECREILTTTIVVRHVSAK